MATAKRGLGKGAKLRVDFYVADDIRFEQNGKLTAVGLYTDRVVVALLEAGQDDPTPDVPLAFGGLTFVFAVGGLQGPHQVGFEYSDPTPPSSEMRASNTGVFGFPNEDGTANLVGKFQPYATGGFGMKTVTLSVDGAEVSRGTFEIRRGARAQDEPAADVRAVKSISTASKKSGRSAAKNAHVSSRPTPRR